MHSASTTSSVPRLLRVSAWAGLALYAATLLTLTHVPKPPGVLEKAGDKTLHLLAYFALGALAYLAATIQFPRRNGLALWVVLLGMIFAAIDEATQPLFGRTADIFDWRADAIGLILAVTALACTRFIGRRYLRRRVTP